MEDTYEKFLISPCHLKHMNLIITSHVSLN